MGEERWLDDREQRAWRSLMTMHADLSQYLERTLRGRSGLSMPDYEVLALDQRGHFAVLTPQGRTAVEAAAGPHVADVRAIGLNHMTSAQLDLVAELADLVRERTETLETGER